MTLHLPVAYEFDDTFTTLFEIFESINRLPQAGYTVAAARCTDVAISPQERLEADNTNTEPFRSVVHIVTFSYPMGLYQYSSWDSGVCRPLPPPSTVVLQLVSCRHEVQDLFALHRLLDMYLRAFSMVLFLWFAR